jgi:hypothetical protein
MTSRLKTKLRKRLKRIEAVRQILRRWTREPNTATEAETNAVYALPIPHRLIPLHDAAYPHAKARLTNKQYTYLKDLALTENWNWYKNEAKHSTNNELRGAQESSNWPGGSSPV